MVYVYPHFFPKELTRMKAKAAEILRRRGPQREGMSVRRMGQPKPHEQGLCERCKQLGHACTMAMEDVMGDVFYVSTRDRRARNRRLEKGERMVLYHQTSPEIAAEILRTHALKPGTKGMAGGGIYFATTPEDTLGKAQRTGTILRCTVKLGKVKTLPSEGDPSLDFARLQQDKEGPFDSVLIPRDRPERVVYMSDQVEEIEYHSGVRPP